MSQSAPKPKREYGARVVTRYGTESRPRYYKSPRLAVEGFRALNQRLQSAGRPLLSAELEGVRGWEQMYDPVTLTPTTSGAVVVRRAAKFDDVPVVSNWWGA